MPTEQGAAAVYIKERLRSDPTIQSLIGNRSRHGVAAGGSDYPLVTYHLMSGVDLVGGGAERIAVNCVYLIEAIGKGSGFEEIDPIAKRIDDLFGQLQDELSGNLGLCSYREQPFEQEDVDQSIVFYRRGGLYRVLIHT